MATFSDVDLFFCIIYSVCRDNDIGAGNERSYWAKGTGFGTGSTSSGWDVEQAMLKQKAEEEHVTCLLQVRAEFHTNNLLKVMSSLPPPGNLSWLGTNMQQGVSLLIVKPYGF